jgi:hypothetical protein
VPKRELFSAMQELLDTFKAKITAADKDALVAWREGPQDDLVLAVAIAAWEGERCQGFCFLGSLYPLRLAGSAIEKIDQELSFQTWTPGKVTCLAKSGRSTFWTGRCGVGTLPPSQ